MLKSELEAIAKGLKSSLGNSIKKKNSKEVRKSTSTPDIEVIKENVSLSKYMRGAIFNTWTGADDELALYKALGQDVGNRGGFLVPEQLASGIVELLKDKAKVRSMPGVKTITMTGDKMKFNTVSSGPSISWGSESGTIAEDTGLGFAQETLETHKAVCLYKMSRELLDNANPSVDAILRMELADALGLEEDKVALQGVGGTQPVGIYYNPRVVSTDLSGVLGIDDLKDALYNLRLQNTEVNGWIAHPRTVNTLAQLKDSHGRYMFGQGPGESGISNLWGAPLANTTQIAITGYPSSTESYMIGGDWSQLIIGEKPGIRIETSTEADTAFAADQVWLKLVKHVGTLLRHPQSFAVIKGIQA